ncbi:hypothetical protein [Marimonas arenosa]|uniref:Peptidase M23 n=1 Tax=Marimonas arenosa TaxID=1795305 RepID=A0AAE4B578_9RHOB|nr:hypothetical protein [Marimonas arenosa]MDQ2090862.1 hypothetical protein [Marimonas arenosa]
MKYALPLVLFASPALAHSGAHLHPQEAAPSIMLIALFVIFLGGMLAHVVRR